MCSACNFADKKNNKIDWNLREKSFKIFATNIEEKMDIGMWLFHAVEEKTVFMLLTCKRKYNMNPLTATWAPCYILMWVGETFIHD